MRRHLLVLLLVASACTAPGAGDAARVRTSPVPPASETAAARTPIPTTAPVPTTTPRPVGAFDPDLAMRHVTALAADIGNRMSGTEGDQPGARYIRDVLAGLGYEASLEAFPLPQGGESWNVIGVPRGLDVTRDRYLLVGGHHDSLNGPGANDNASGVAVALAAAHALTEVPSPLPVVVVAFGAEERQPTPRRPHHVGSRHRVASMSEAERENLVAFLNVDMVGRGPTILVCHLDQGPEEATDRLLRLASDLGIPARERVTPDWSDNGPYLKAGMNAGWLWTGEDPAYHSPEDTADRVQRPALERAGRLSLAFLRSYA